jgi:hypothetical protein
MAGVTATAKGAKAGDPGGSPETDGEDGKIAAVSKALTSKGPAFGGALQTPEQVRDHPTSVASPCGLDLIAGMTGDMVKMGFRGLKSSYKPTPARTQARTLFITAGSKTLTS